MREYRGDGTLFYYVYIYTPYITLWGYINVQEEWGQSSRWSDGGRVREDYISNEGIYEVVYKRVRRVIE